MAMFRRIVEDYEARLTSPGPAGGARAMASVRLSNRQGDPIPAVRAGDRLEVCHRSVVVLAGVFRPD